MFKRYEPVIIRESGQRGISWANHTESTNSVWIKTSSNKDPESYPIDQIEPAIKIFRIEFEDLQRDHKEILSLTTQYFQQANLGEDEWERITDLIFEEEVDQNFDELVNIFEYEMMEVNKFLPESERIGFDTMPEKGVHPYDWLQEPNENLIDFINNLQRKLVYNEKDELEFHFIFDPVDYIGLSKWMGK